MHAFLSAKGGDNACLNLGLCWLLFCLCDLKKETDKALKEERVSGEVHHGKEIRGLEAAGHITSTTRKKGTRNAGTTSLSHLHPVQGASPCNAATSR